MQRRWKPFVVVHVAGVAGLGVALLVSPSLLPFPAMNSASAVGASVASVAACFALSVRQLRLSWVGTSIKPFFVSIGFALVGVSSLVWVGRATFTAGFWLAHVLDIAGVFGIAIGSAIALRSANSSGSAARSSTYSASVPCSTTSGNSRPPTRSSESPIASLTRSSR